MYYAHLITKTVPHGIHLVPKLRTAQCCVSALRSVTKLEISISQCLNKQRVLVWLGGKSPSDIATIKNSIIGRFQQYHNNNGTTPYVQINMWFLYMFFFTKNSTSPHLPIFFYIFMLLNSYRGFMDKKL